MFVIFKWTPKQSAEVRSVFLSQEGHAVSYEKMYMLDVLGSPVSYTHVGHEFSADESTGDI